MAKDDQLGLNYIRHEDNLLGPVDAPKCMRITPGIYKALMWLMGTHNRKLTYPSEYEEQNKIIKQLKDEMER